MGFCDTYKKALKRYVEHSCRVSPQGTGVLGKSVKLKCVGLLLLAGGYTERPCGNKPSAAAGTFRV